MHHRVSTLQSLKIFWLHNVCTFCFFCENYPLFENSSFVFALLVYSQPIRPGNSSLYLPYFEWISPRNGWPGNCTTLLMKSPCSTFSNGSNSAWLCWKQVTQEVNLIISFTGTLHCTRTGRWWQLGLVKGRNQCALAVLPEIPHPVRVPWAGRTGQVLHQAACVRPPQLKYHGLAWSQLGRESCTAGREGGYLNLSDPLVLATEMEFFLPSLCIK